MTEQSLQNLDLTQINEIAFSQTDNGQVLAEVFIQPQYVPQGNGSVPRFIVAGLEIRLSDSNEIEVHNLYQDNIPHNAYIQYLNYQEHDDGSYDYDGIRVLIFEQAHLSPNDEDAKHTFDFNNLRDCLIYLKEQYKAASATPTTNSRIKDPLGSLFPTKR